MSVPHCCFKGHRVPLLSKCHCRIRKIRQIKKNDFTQRVWKINLNISACSWKVLFPLKQIAAAHEKLPKKKCRKHAMYSLLVNDKNVSFMSTNLRRLERDLHYSATNQHNSHLSFLLYSPPTVPYVLLSHLSNESGIGLLSSCITQLLNPVASKHSTVDKRQCMQKFSGVL